MKGWVEGNGVSPHNPQLESQVSSDDVIVEEEEEEEEPTSEPHIHSRYVQSCRAFGWVVLALL